MSSEERNGSGQEPEPTTPRPPSPDGKSSRVWRIAKIVLGAILVPLGIVGLFVPVLQGVILLLVAVALLASEIPAVARLRDALRKRYPGPFERADRFKDRLRDFFR